MERTSSRAGLPPLWTTAFHGAPGIYRYTPKPQLDRAFDAANEKLTQPMNALQFLRILAPVVAQIKCGHTSVRPPQKIADALDQTVPLFPLDVAIVDGKVYVIREIQPNDQKLAGVQIRKINEVPIDRILSTMLAATPGDADSRTVRPSRVAYSFEWDLYDLLGMEAPFRVQFREGKTGKNRTMDLPGIAFPDREKIFETRYPQDASPKIRPI